jgi:hypothetical protein
MDNDTARSDDDPSLQPPDAPSVVAPGSAVAPPSVVATGDITSMSDGSLRLPPGAPRFNDAPAAPDGNVAAQ